MKSFNTILIEKQQEYQHYHQVKKAEGKEMLPSDQSRMIERAKFTYSPLGKAFTNKNDRRAKILQFEAFKEHGKEIEGD